MKNVTTMTALLNSTMRMTPAELAAGRFMRAPDDHPTADPPPADPPAADPPAADAPAADPPAETPAEDGETVVGGATGPDDEESDEPSEPEAAVVPETYELEPFKVGEGDDAVEIAIDQELLTTSTPVFKDAGLTNDQVKKLAPLALKVEERVRTALADQSRAITSDWAKEAKADPDMGGQNWGVTTNNVAKALDHFAATSVKEKQTVNGKEVEVETQPFRKMLNETGLGNHPELIRMFAKIGAAVSEDGDLPRGDKGTAIKVPRENSMYPDDVPK